MVLRADHLGGRVRILTAAGALACVVGVVSILQSGGNPDPRLAATALLTSGTDFGLSGTVGDLAPGLSSRLILRATNPGRRAITLRKVTIVVSAVPARCPVAGLTIDAEAFAGSPPALTITGLRALVPARASATVSLAIRLARRVGDRCQRARFPLSYSGEATTGNPGTATSVHLTSFPNPSEADLPVVFRATVEVRRLVRAQPAGDVTFYLCIDPRRLPSGSPASACIKSARLGPPVDTRHGKSASLIVTSLRPGSHAIFAKFTPDVPGFSPSASTTVTQRVIFFEPLRGRASVRGARRR